MERPLLFIPRMDNLASALENVLGKVTTRPDGTIDSALGVAVREIATPRGRAWAIFAIVGRHDRMDPRVALAHNARMVVGGLAIEGQALVVRHVSALAVDVPLLALAVAQEAARLRARTIRRAAPAVHEFYAD